MSVWLPMWPIESRRRREPGPRPGATAPRSAPDGPVLLVASDRRRRVVARCCGTALAAGVRPGMPLAQARALFDDAAAARLRLLPHEPDRDRAALRSLAAWAQRFSPIAAVDTAGPEPDGLLLDVSGCAAVFGGESALLESAEAQLARLGFSARAAIAPTVGCAWALARFARAEGPDASTGESRRESGGGGGGGPLRVVDPAGVRGVLAPLPLEALRLEAGVVAGLAEVGIDRVGQVMDLPRSALPARFGPTLLLRLDQALGQAIETFEPVRPTPPPVAERVFEGPTDKPEAIEHTVRDLLAQVAHELARRSCGARVVSVELARSDLGPERLRVTLGRPSRDAGHLWALLRPGLERAHLGFGVEAVRVRAEGIARLKQEQRRHDGEAEAATGAQAERARGELLDTLANRLGRGAVLRAEPAESHLPERAFVLRPAQADAEGTPERPAGFTDRDRPTVLFERPFAADVVALTPDGPVHRVRWAGGDEAVEACVGPERLSAEWWRQADPARAESARDCFAVRTESGRWLWLVRGLPEHRWFVHGVWA